MLLENDHRAFVEVVPTAKESSEEAERLAAIKQTLDTAQLEAIMAEAEELHRIQMAVSYTHLDVYKRQISSAGRTRGTLIVCGPTPNTASRCSACMSNPANS